jgi:peptidoglycan/LPS O-acetylase OafA/YrhL
MTETLAGTRTSTLTGLRGLALLMVLATGFAAAGVLPSEFGSGLDQIGLMIVVALSGFLLAIHHGNERWDRYAVGDFLRDRAKRLLPLYFLMLAFAAAITGWWSDWPYRVDSLPVAARAILLIDAPGPLWIVPALAHMYLLFVVVWWMWFRRGSTQEFRGLHLIVVLVFGCAVSVLALPLSGGTATGLFLVGVAIGLTWDEHIAPFVERHARVVAIVGGVAFVLACVNLPAVRLAHGWAWGFEQQSATWNDPLTVLIVIVLIIAAAAKPLSLAVLASPPLQWLGRSFYPVYLLVPVLVAVAK